MENYFHFCIFNMISLTSAVAAGVIYQNVNIKKFSRNDLRDNEP